MPRSKYAQAVDEIQSVLRPALKADGFKVRGRTFNRVTDDGLTQVISLQMGASDPPGANHIPGLREDLHGLFTVNLGVYVPEVAKHHVGVEAKSWVQEYHCCVRARLGAASGEKDDIWWHARVEDAAISDVQRRLEQAGLPFLNRHSSREKILVELKGRSKAVMSSDLPWIVMTIILAERGRKDEARALLADQFVEAHNAEDLDFVRRLAKKLSLGSLDGLHPGAADGAPRRHGTGGLGARAEDLR